MEHVTQQAAASAEESAAAGVQMTAQAEAMMGVVGRLKEMVDGGTETGGDETPGGEGDARKPKLSQDCRFPNQEEVRRSGNGNGRRRTGYLPHGR